MRAREGPPARLRVQHEPAWQDRLEVDGALPVPELPAVVVALVAVEPGRSVPTEEDVARGLHQSLAFDYALAAVLELAPAEVGLQHRILGLLDLEEQWIVGVASEHQDDPAARADAADADHLAREVDVRELL